MYWTFGIKKHQGFQKFLADFRVQQATNEGRFFLWMARKKIAGIIKHDRLAGNMSNHRKRYLLIQPGNSNLPQRKTVVANPKDGKSWALFKEPEKSVWRIASLDALMLQGFENRQIQFVFFETWDDPLNSIDIACFLDDTTRLKAPLKSVGYGQIS